MAIVIIQGEEEKRKGIHFEFDSDAPPLGEGGMGMVMLGWMVDRRSGQRREVAIKFLYSDLPPHVIARARREAGVQLRNDCLIEMMGFVETADRDELGQHTVRYHVVSEYLRGVTLDQLMQGKVTDHRDEIIPFAQELHGKYLNDPYHFAITVVRSVLSGLMALHDAGYIHRDIDPSNIMVTANGKIKLIDFGIAKKTVGKNTKESSYTVDGQFIGKPKYAAPELARGLVDAQSAPTDLYAVGIMLFQLVTGHVPFDGDMAEVLDMQLNKKLPLSQIKQKQLREVIGTATQKKKTMRFQSAAEFRVAVDKLMPLAYPEKSLDFNKLFKFGGIAAALLLIAGGAAFGISKIGSSDSVADDPVPSGPIAVKDTLPSYTVAKAMLMDQATAAEGIRHLQRLSDNGDADATFLLSRIYFSSPQNIRVTDFSDTVSTIRQNLGNPVDNVRAHNLLIKAVNQDSDNVRYLFELGLDYKSDSRGASIIRDSALYYLDKAQKVAISTGNDAYLNAIRPRISNL